VAANDVDPADFVADGDVLHADLLPVGMIGLAVNRFSLNLTVASGRILTIGYCNDIGEQKYHFFSAFIA